MKNSIKVATVISYITLLLSNIIAIFYTPYMISTLGKSEYGVYALVNTVVSYLAFLDFGLGDAVIRYNSKYMEKKNEKKQSQINGMFLKLYLAISIISIIVGVIIYFNLENIFSTGLDIEEIILLKKLLIIAIINIALSFPLSVYGGIIISYEKFTFSKVIDLIRRVITPIFIVIILIFGYKAIGMLIVTTAINIIIGIVNVLYCHIKLSIKFDLMYFDKSMLMRIMKFSFFLFLGAIAYQIYWNTDQVILGAYVSASAITIFSIGNQFNGYYLSFSNVISNMFLPKFTKLIVNNKATEEVMGILIKVSRIQMYIASYIIIGFIIIGRAFIYRWLDKSYDDSYYLALILMVPQIFSIIQSLFPILLEAMNKHKVKSFIYLSVSIVNLAISLILVRFIGYYGCAIGTAIGMIINFLANNVYYYKVLKLNMKYYWIQISKTIVPILISAVLGLVIAKIINPSSYVQIIIVGSIYTIEFIIFCWLICFNDYEKNILKKFIPLIK